MRTTSENNKLWFLAIILLLLAAIALSAPAQAQEQSGAESEASIRGGITPHKWSKPLPAKTCPGSSTDTNCQTSSTTIADVNGDGFKDIIAVTNNGHVVVMNHQGQLLWDTDVSPAFGMAANSQEINSTPAVGDIDADGKAEIAVGVGTTRTNTCTQGGLIVLNHAGRVESGWPQLAEDWDIPPAGCRDSIFSSPALGDLDKDGDLEIVAGGFDKRIYAWHHDGSLLPGFSPDSFHKSQPSFSDWHDLKGRLADTIWSSPALGDLDRDGYLDIIIGTDEGNMGPGWNCHYSLPSGWMEHYCGGSIYAIDRFGNLLPGFPRYFYETIDSTPALADINDDGALEIVVGTGNFYYEYSSDRPRDGFRLFVLDNQGRDLAGWAGGKSVGGPVVASPTVGDIAGDNGLEIVVPVMGERKLYAWHANGTAVAGFPTKPVDLFGNALATFDIGSSTILADYDGDKKLEILFNQAWSVTIVDGDGRLLTGDNFPENTRPIYYAEGALLNNPAVADLDKDGQLELIAHNSNVYVWDLPRSLVNSGQWASFKRDSQGRSQFPLPPRLSTARTELFVLSKSGSDGGGGSGDTGPLSTDFVTLRNEGQGELLWTATAPEGISLSQNRGTLDRQVNIEVQINAAGYEDGIYELGEIVITATSNGEPVQGSPLRVPVKLWVGEFSSVFLPTLSQ